VRDALARAGWRPRRLELISPLGVGKGVRYAYRVETDDGRTVKARQFGSDAEAERVETLRRGIDDAFAPVLGRIGPVLIEAWLDGTMLAGADAEAWTQTAGAVLGRLHAHRAGADAVTGTASWTAAASADLALLQQVGALSATDADRVRAALDQGDPRRARVGLIHKDFCAENMLIDARRRLRIIDTELITVDPLAFDLGWTWHRWPMSPRGWERFTAGYRSTAPAEPEAEAYWRIATGLTLARVFLQRMPARLDAQLASLSRCVAAASARA
jgi:Ser/Thr protein kinase RdoA (MazF antagonist)